MSLRFIIGTVGSGKTYTCLKEINQIQEKQPLGHPLFMLVPEQSTFQTGTKLLKMHSKKAMTRANVSSFHRLVYFFRDYIKNYQLPNLDSLGQLMIMQHILINKQNDFKIFGAASKQVGLTKSMLDLWQEFSNYKISSIDLESLSANPHLDNNLAEKLADFSIISQEMSEYIDNQYNTTDILMQKTAETIYSFPNIQNIEFWIDGFSSFNNIHLDIIKALLTHAKKVNIALCLPPNLLKIKQSLPEDHVFYELHQTYLKLKNIATENNISQDKTLYLVDNVTKENFNSLGRFKNNNSLAYLAESFSNETISNSLSKFYNQKSKPQNIELFSANNQQAEIEAVGKKIIKLCRDKNYRYKDIGVLMRDIDTYAPTIKQVFKTLNIPCFLDHKINIMHHPLVELIRSVLEIVLENWAYEPMFRYLKTDLIDISRDEIDKLENYCLGHGINKYHWWNKEWTYYNNNRLTIAEKDLVLKDFNQNRAIILEQLEEIQALTKKDFTVKELINALNNLLANLNIDEKMQIWQEKSLAAEDLLTAEENRQVISGVANVLNQFEAILGDAQLPLKQIIDILDEGFNNLNIATIPPGLDEVSMTDVVRSRVPDLKVLFVIGLNDGIFPKQIIDEGLLQAAERDQLKDIGYSIGASSKQKQFGEQYLLYIALSRPSEILYLSYSLADNEGDGLYPSVAIRQLKEVFPYYKDADKIKQYALEWQENEDPKNFIISSNYTLEPLLQEIAQRNYQQNYTFNFPWQDVYNWYINNNNYKWQIKALENILVDHKAYEILPEDLREQLYGNLNITSISQLELYQKCSFAYFANYGLHLQKRPEYDLTPKDIGNFFHNILAELNNYLNKKNISWEDLSDDKLKNIVDKLVPEVLDNLKINLGQKSAYYRYMQVKMSKTVLQTGKAIVKQEQKSAFKPRAWEASFGPNKNLKSPSLKTKDNQNIFLEGYIDRIDIAYDEKTNSYYTSIIDYKLSDKTLKLADIYYGINIQLPLYLAIVLANSQTLCGSNQLLPAGMFYLSIQKDLLNYTNIPDLEKVTLDWLRQYKLNGFVFEDLNAIKLLDQEIVGHSDIIPAGLSKKDKLYSNYNAIKMAEWPLLTRFLYNKIQEILEKIQQGYIEISPWQDKKIKACDYCDFKPICSLELEEYPKDRKPYLNDHNEVMLAIIKQVNQNSKNDKSDVSDVID